MTGAMLMGEEEGVAGAGPEKEVEEVAVLEGRWRRIAVEANSENCLFPVLQQLMESTVFNVDSIIFIYMQCVRV